MLNEWLALVGEEDAPAWESPVVGGRQGFSLRLSGTLEPAQRWHAIHSPLGAPSASLTAAGPFLKRPPACLQRECWALEAPASSLGRPPRTFSQLPGTFFSPSCCLGDLRGSQVESNRLALAARTAGAFPWLVPTTAKRLTGSTCAREALELKSEGFLGNSAR